VGSELKCQARFGEQVGEGKALLETSELIFRGPFRLKIPFTQMKSVKAVDGELHVQFAEGKASFALGPQAEKWANKILHPKSRMEKLGIKPGAKVSVIGELDESFKRELEEVTSAVTHGKVAADAEWIFLCAESVKELAQSGQIAKALRGAMALWIVYPKGRKDLSETDVISTGRGSGLKDVKVVGFSSTHTALKFVVPLANR
jgi:hypothetical protein